MYIMYTTHGKSFCVVFDSGNGTGWKLGELSELLSPIDLAKTDLFFALEDFRLFSPWKSRKFLCVRDILWKKVQQLTPLKNTEKRHNCFTFIHVDLVQYLDHMKMICFRIGVLSSRWVRESWVCVGSYLYKSTKELPGVLDTWCFQGWSICDLTFNAVRTRWSLFHLKVGVARVTHIARWFLAVNKAP